MSSPPATTNASPESPSNTGGRDIIGEVDGLFSNIEYDAFCRESIGFAVELTSARSCFLFRSDPTGKMIPAAQFHRQGYQFDPNLAPEVEKLANYTRETATSQKVTLTAKDQKMAALTVPFMGADGPTVLILLLGAERAPFLEPTYGMLSLFGAVMANYSNRVQFQKTKDAFLQSTLLVDLYTKASTANDYESATAIVTSELQELIGCDHLAIGLEKKGRMRLDSLSGRKKREKRSQGFSKVLNLMREVKSAESPVMWPAPDDLEYKALIASNQDNLLETFAVGRIMGVPLIPNDGERTGAMVVMFRDRNKPTPDNFELLTAMGPHLAALLALLSDGLPTGIRGKMTKFAREASIGKKFITFLTPVALIASMFIPVPHQIRAAARLTPDISRQVAAQFGGILEDVLVKPGDVVEKDELLATLDGKEIGSQLAGAIAKREVVRKRRDQARAREDIAEYQLAIHEFNALDLEVEFLRYQQQNLEIRSPIKGLILTGDLARSKGVPVETGQKLFEVADFEKFVTEISVTDEDINWVKEEQEVALRLESRGGKVFESKIEQIYPVSEVADGDNVFVCLAYITDEGNKNFLRPGMRGRARVKAGWKPLGWVIFYKPYNYIKVRYF